jgi:hypothetical protein
MSRRLTHCKNGHDIAVMGRTASRGVCRACQKTYNAAYYRKLKTDRPAYLRWRKSQGINVKEQ